MTEFAIGQTVIVQDELRIIHDLQCDGIALMYGTFPVSVQKRIEANPAIAYEANFRSRYFRLYTESELRVHTKPKPIRIPTHMGVIVVRAVEPTCSVPAIITELELPDGSVRELSKVYGFQHQNQININLLDGNHGYAIHKATYTDKSLNCKKEESHETWQETTEV